MFWIIYCYMHVETVLCRQCHLFVHNVIFCTFIFGALALIIKKIKIKKQYPFPDVLSEQHICALFLSSSGTACTRTVMRALQDEPVLRFICGVWAKHVQRCRYNIQLSNRTGSLRWVTDQNKDGVVGWTFNSSFLVYFFVLCLFYHFKWQTVSNLFIFLCCTFHRVNSKMLN